MVKIANKVSKNKEVKIELELNKYIDYDRWKNLCHLATKAENPPLKEITIVFEQIALDWQDPVCYNNHIATHYRL